ncbi:DUF262 domain-containing protein [Levilactobacillus hammesii]|uniref:DUF262 domain-containing protein n=1 Tax=Levilactobacillus hammesii DSM 16381 TaxID=1423753 RepID=A0A0R1UUV8_9LACO|nr:DUF262 domain-containing protein [Levilactobacillus hammesii]KRL96887.1 hypothetical protein FD28_GL001816 [Levilactobacillus hammesii DSM 16381]
MAKLQGNPQFIVPEVIQNTKKINIPIYQRRYSWGIEQIQRLVDDMVMAHDQQLKQYFIGSLILDTTQANISEVSVIDGQQRLTTISLFLIALRDAMTATDPETSQMINDRFLIDRYDHTSLHHNRLNPVKGDAAQYIDVLLHGDDAQPSLFQANYHYFKTMLSTSDTSASDWFALLQSQLQTMVITVQPGDDAQLIFESLNSTGLSLTEADKIRNYLLMSLSNEEQAKAFETWQAIEKIVHPENVPNFYRHYLTSLARSSKPVKKGKIYIDYRQYIGLQPNFDRYTELKHEKDIAQTYAQIQFPYNYNFDDPQTQQLLIRLSHLKMDVMMPYLLQVFNHEQKEELTAASLNEVLATLLSYLARRLFVGIPSTGLNNFFASLDRQVMRLSHNQSVAYDVALKAVLTHAVKENKIFPTNAEVLQALNTKDYYHIRTESFWFILNELNNVHGESQDLFTKSENGSYSIEHIMPQTLSTAWKKELGPDWHDIQLTWLNRLANLTLTGFNSQMSNHTFAEKRDAPDGYHDSGIRLNQELARLTKWDTDSLKSRQADLYQRILAVWPVPDVSDLSIESTDWTSLEDIDPKGRKPISFKFHQQPSQPVKSWKELYNALANQLWLNNPAAFFQMANDDHEWLIKYASEVDTSDYRKLSAVSDEQTISIFNGNSSASERKKYLQRLLNASDDSLSSITVRLAQSEPVASH